MNGLVVSYYDTQREARSLGDVDVTGRRFLKIIIREEASTRSESNTYGVSIPAEQKPVTRRSLADKCNEAKGFS